MFAFALAFLGFIYPDLVRFSNERRHARVLNRLVADATAYQQNAALHYMTTKDIRESFALAAPQRHLPIDTTTDTTDTTERTTEDG
jgi:hypothetical protein